MRVIACRTAFGQGGLGQHFEQLVEESRAAGELAAYFAHTVKPGDEEIGRQIDFVRLKWLRTYSPLRFTPAWISFIGENIFDSRVASELDIEATAFMGFVGKSLRSFGRARSLGYRVLELVAANSHVHNVQRLHRLAARNHGRRDTWLNDALARKTLREYTMADRIYVHSEYTRSSLIAEGIPDHKLRRTYLKVSERFKPAASKPEDGKFRIVYVGRLDTTKGIPLLRRALSSLESNDIELTLVGGWSSSMMRRYIRRWMASDPRVKLSPGDPLPALQKADVCVHPTYEDGFAYAPMEALACRVPVIVSEDTGMKEYVREGENGYVVPTGHWEPLVERIEYLIRHPLSIAGAGPSEMV